MRAADRAVTIDGRLAGSDGRVEGTAITREIKLWTLLATAALGIAGGFALLLALSRAPGIERLPWPIDFFHKGLVIHVIFSFIIWFLAVFALQGAMMLDPLRHAGWPARLGQIGIIGTALSFPLLFVPAFLDRGEATLNNYIPTIVDPLYYAGLVILLLAIAAAGARIWLTRGAPASRPPAPQDGLDDTGSAGFAMAGATAAYFVSLGCFALAAVALRDSRPGYGFNEDLFWGGGHGLQFVNTLALIAAWCHLARPWSAAGPLRRRMIRLAIAVLALAVLPLPLLYAIYPPFSAEQTQAFTAAQYALGPPAVLVFVTLLLAARRPWPWGTLRWQAMVLSGLLFCVGGALGLFVDGADTRTPAHYHGVIAGVTLAFMGVFYTVVLPLLGRPVPAGRWPRLQVHLFAWGQLAACLGLFVAGGYGAPRKVAGAAQGLEAFGAYAGMAVNGLGGLVAFVGGGLFVWLMLKSLIDAPEKPAAVRAQ